MMALEGQRTPSALWIIPFIVSVFGIVAIASMTAWDVDSPAFRQILWLGLSLMVFVAVSLIPTVYWLRYSALLWLLALVLTAMTLWSPWAVTVKGASRWLSLGAVNFQPLELISLSLMLHLSKLYHRIDRSARALAVTLYFLLPMALLLLLQPDFGGTLLIVAVAGAIFVDRYGFGLPLLMAVPSAAILGLMASRASYRIDRIAMWLDPWQDPMGDGYQLIQGLIAFANGGLTGIGLSRGQGFLPEVHNDFIFPAIGEELGVGATGTLFLLFVIWCACVLVAYRRATPLRRTLIWGCGISILLPLLINLGGVMKLIPLTGMPLPFVSYGGTSLLFMWIRVGILLRLTREEASEEELEPWQ